MLIIAGEEVGGAVIAARVAVFVVDWIVELAKVHLAVLVSG